MHAKLALALPHWKGTGIKLHFERKYLFISVQPSYIWIDKYANRT